MDQDVATEAEQTVSEDGAVYAGVIGLFLPAALIAALVAAARGRRRV
ncbi:hypothetical protein KW076_01710 [Micrococcus porci]|nr:hypothetical protein [Micrococcus porci]UBH24943.1 hypothetical protein KW076_01710 [Micrococcus porci]